MRNIFTFIKVLALVVHAQYILQESAYGQFSNPTFAAVSKNKKLENYGVVAWLSIDSGNNMKIHSLGFTPDQGFVDLRNLFSNQLGVRPARIRIVASSGQLIQDEASLQHYVMWCIEQNTPMIFFVKVK